MPSGGCSRKSSAARWCGRWPSSRATSAAAAEVLPPSVADELQDVRSRKLKEFGDSGLTRRTCDQSRQLLEAERCSDASHLVLRHIVHRSSTRRCPSAARSAAAAHDFLVAPHRFDRRGLDEVADGRQRAELRDEARQTPRARRRSSRRAPPTRSADDEQPVRDRFAVTEAAVRVMASSAWPAVWPKLSMRRSPDSRSSAVDDVRLDAAATRR